MSKNTEIETLKKKKKALLLTFFRIRRKNGSTENINHSFFEFYT
jgi:hypothetical protein